MLHFLLSSFSLGSDFSVSEFTALLSKKEKSTFQLLLTRYFISLSVSMSQSRKEFDGFQEETSPLRSKRMVSATSLTKFLSDYYVQAMGHRPTTGGHFWNFVLLMKWNKVRRRQVVEFLGTGLSLPASWGVTATEASHLSQSASLRKLKLSPNPVHSRLSTDTEFLSLSPCIPVYI